MARFGTEVGPSLSPKGVPIIGWNCESFPTPDLLSVFEFMRQEVCIPEYDMDVWERKTRIGLSETHTFSNFASQYPDQVRLISGE